MFKYMENNNLTTDEIKNIINQYKNKRDREKKNYHEKLKCNAEWCQGNKERALKHYYKNIDKNKEKYQKNKDFINSRSMFQYYKRNNRIQEFTDKYPEKVILLKSRGVIIEADETKNNILLSFN